jgi:hypothetical protein
VLALARLDERKRAAISVKNVDELKVDEINVMELAEKSDWSNDFMRKPLFLDRLPHLLRLRAPNRQTRAIDCVSPS